MEVIKTVGFCMGPSILGNCAGTLLSKVVTSRGSFANAALAGAVAGGISASFHLSFRSDYFKSRMKDFHRKNTRNMMKKIMLTAVTILGTTFLTPSLAKQVTKIPISHYASSAYGVFSLISIVFAIAIFKSKKESSSSREHS